MSVKENAYISGGERLGTTLEIDAGHIYLKAADSGIYAYNGATPTTPTRRLSFPDPNAGTFGGTLHGYWQADNILSSSDAKLKRNIAPLQGRILEQMSSSDGDKTRGGSRVGLNQRFKTGQARTEIGHMGGRAKAVDWVLRELRPVSFSYRDGPEVKNAGGNEGQKVHYGFIAQEVEKVLPDIVFQTGDKRLMMYQDLIAMNTLVAQEHQDRLEEYSIRHRADMQEVRADMQEVRAENHAFQKRVQELHDMYGFMQELVELLRAELRDLRRENQEVLEQHQAELQDMRAKYEGKLLQHQVEQQQHQVEQQWLRNTVSELSGQVSELVGLIPNMSAQLAMVVERLPASIGSNHSQRG